MGRGQGEQGATGAQARRDEPGHDERPGAVDAIGLIETMDEVEAAYGALREREKELRDQGINETLSRLSPGMRVRICDPISPKYLKGLTGIVSPGSLRRGKTVLIKLDSPELAGRYARPSGEIGVYANCVEAVDGEGQEGAAAPAAPTLSQGALPVGTQVRIVGNIGPRYIVGLTGTVAVMGFGRSRVPITLDEPTKARQYADGQGQIRVPRENLEAL
jgi:hypothetical protein